MIRSGDTRRYMGFVKLPPDYQEERPELTGWKADIADLEPSWRYRFIYMPVQR